MANLQNSRPERPREKVYNGDIAFSKEKTILISCAVDGSGKINPDPLLDAIELKCGIGSVLACVPKIGLGYEVVFRERHLMEPIVGELSFENKRLKVSELESTFKYVSIINLSMYVTDSEIIDRFSKMGVEVVSEIKKHKMNSKYKVYDGTRTFKAKLPPNMRSIPYSMKFSVNEKETAYYRVMHNDQVRVCYGCFSSDHIYKDCPEFVCYDCGEQGHMKKKCPKNKCAFCHYKKENCKCKSRPDVSFNAFNPVLQPVRQKTTLVDSNPANSTAKVRKINVNADVHTSNVCNDGVTTEDEVSFTGHVSGGAVVGENGDGNGETENDIGDGNGGNGADTGGNGDGIGEDGNGVGDNGDGVGDNGDGVSDIGNGVGGNGDGVGGNGDGVGGNDDAVVGDGDGVDGNGDGVGGNGGVADVSGNGDGVGVIGDGASDIGVAGGEIGDDDVGGNGDGVHETGNASGVNDENGIGITYSNEGSEMIDDDDVSEMDDVIEGSADDINTKTSEDKNYNVRTDCNFDIDTGVSCSEPFKVDSAVSPLEHICSQEEVSHCDSLDDFGTGTFLLINDSQGKSDDDFTVVRRKKAALVVKRRNKFQLKPNLKAARLSNLKKN